MIYDIKDYLSQFFQKRLHVLAAFIFLLFSIIVIRVFSLQIVNGENYQDNFVMLIEKPLTKDEKNMRKSLNRWYYTTKKRTLKSVYNLMLKNFYCK